MAKIYVYEIDLENGTCVHKVPEDLVMHELSVTEICVCGPNVDWDIFEDGSALITYRHYALDPQHRWSRPLPDND